MTTLNRKSLLIGCALIVAVISLLSWLFLKADSISSAEHEHYGREIRILRQADSELNAAILANRFGMQTDFDTITLAVATLGEEIDDISDVPAFLSDEDRARVIEKVGEYRAALELKSQLINRFKREHSVLRNSLAYLPLATDTLVEDPSAPIALTRPVGIFARNVMTHAQTGNSALRDKLVRDLDTLDSLARQSSGAFAQQIGNVLRHGRVVIERDGAVDEIMRSALAIPTARVSEELAQIYAQGYERASWTAHNFRVSLFILALLLMAYLALVMIRLGRTSGELARTNRLLRERIETLDHTQHELRLYANVFTSAAEGMLITDKRGRIEAINPAFSDITGFSADEMRGQLPSRLKSGRQPESFYRQMWRALAQRGKWQGEIWNRRKNGEIYPEWLSITAVKDDSGDTSHYIGLFSDISERKNAEDRIQHLAHHDQLTNLANRQLLQNSLEKAIDQSRRTNNHTAVLLLNLDRFKPINDSLGHDLGDALLQQVAHRCQSVVRIEDTVSRPGADEFVIVLPEIIHPMDAAAVARKLLTAISRPYLLGEHEIRITGSVGIAVFEGDGTTPAELLRHADAAMYRAKAEGRDTFQFYAEDMNTESLGDLLLENQLRGAIDRGELELHYQAKVCALDGRLTGAEALLRWRHPDLGLISPNRFVPVAEECGLIVSIGEWVLSETCRQLKAWRDAGLQAVPVAINLSAQQFLGRKLVPLVESMLDHYDLPAELLGLELTETMLMRDVDRTMETLGELRDMGIEISIDDFGTGYSSLAYLKKFRVSTLKIDRGFVHDIHRENADGKIAAAVIALAHSLGMTVVAEGVETHAQQDFLREHQCDQLQGYLFGRPMPAHDFEVQLKARSATRQTARADIRTEAVANV